MDLFGPSKTPNLRGKSYTYVIVDDFFRYTCILFLSNKNKNKALDELFKEIQNLKGFAITCIRNKREFENTDFKTYCNEHEIDHNFLAPKAPQQNGVVERKNIILQEMVRTMLNENNLPKYF